MGVHFTDRYSLLHFAAGIVVYYWNVSFVTWFILHMIYEWVENTAIGMNLINRFPYWPGGKDEADTIKNRIGDQFYALVGWGVAHVVCTQG